ncbi:unnamed protein product [Aphanomyces euteiches]|uniref:Thioesterase domain-containing protein n=1 Tax=Aphanomyces euteiches TaxID=100861 RepID=A0A6G0XEQ7_9STRA|nr:hypothetical protein Ae201684_005600 [Aphanomyces euteiches]KAH9078795.1 hypothetical protein Ae201684P_019868 [Aphanomyces euteiches]KAH9140705.1 hypothetical protein AeRB84_015081 [Aphanomyces euteiches]
MADKGSSDDTAIAAKSRSQPSTDLPAKIAAIANDSNYVFLPKEHIWGNEEYGLSSGRSDTIKDFVFADVDQSEKYEVFQLYGHKDKSHTVAYIYFGAALCGGQGVVHGGCIATMFDELLGMTFVWTLGRGGVTVTLTVNYRRRFKANQAGVFFLYLVKAEGRKGFFKGRLEDRDGNVCADATGLFVTPDIPSKL